MHCPEVVTVLLQGNFHKGMAQEMFSLFSACSTRDWRNNSAEMTGLTLAGSSAHSCMGQHGGLSCHSAPMQKTSPLSTPTADTLHLPFGCYPTPDTICTLAGWTRHQPLSVHWFLGFCTVISKWIMCGRAAHTPFLPCLEEGEFSLISPVPKYSYSQKQAQLYCVWVSPIQGGTGYFSAIIYIYITFQVFITTF